MKIQLAALLGLASCQIIINHNNFEPAPVDGPEVDAPVVVVEGASVRTSYNGKQRIAFGRIDWQGGQAILSTPDPAVVRVDKIGVNQVKVQFTDHLWEIGDEPGAPPTGAPITPSIPMCVCESEGSGPESHECVLLDGPSIEGDHILARFASWDGGTPSDHPIMFACVGKVIGSAGELDWTGQGPLVVAGAHWKAGQVLNEHGSWLGTASDDGVDIIPGVFRESPVCFSTAVGAGRFGSRISSVSKTRVTTDDWIANGEPNAPASETLVCIGRGTGSGASRVVSPSDQGAMIFNLNHSLNSFGNWVMGLVDGGGTWTSGFSSGDPFQVAGEPACVFSPLWIVNDRRLLACEQTAPTTTQFQMHMLDAANGTAAPDGGFNMWCVAPRTPSGN